jgi:hypothetical protein
VVDKEERFGVSERSPVRGVCVCRSSTGGVGCSFVVPEVQWLVARKVCLGSAHLGNGGDGSELSCGEDRAGWE